METPRTEKILKLLKELPDGLYLNELPELLNCKLKDASNSMETLRHRGCVIRDKRGHYKINSSQEKISLRTKQDRILEAISNSPEGLTKDEIAKAFDISPKSVSNRIFNLRSQGHNIQNEHGTYKVFGTPSPATTKSATTIPDVVTKTLSPKYQAAYIRLSDSDKIDFADMLRKSIYYHKSAISLLESNLEIETFLSSLGGLYNA